jgi:hypothetical protein
MKADPNLRGLLRGRDSTEQVTRAQEAWNGQRRDTDASMSLPGGLPTNQGALEQGLGNSFTTEMRDAWTAAYVVLANAMKDASRLAA